MAALGLVSPGAATDGVTLILPEKKLFAICRRADNGSYFVTCDPRKPSVS